MHAHINTGIHTYIYKYIHTYIHACMHACIHTYTHTYRHTYMHTYTCIHTYTYMHIHTCIHAYMHTCIHTYRRSCVEAANTPLTGRRARASNAWQVKMNMEMRFEMIMQYHMHVICILTFSNVSFLSTLLSKLLFELRNELTFENFILRIA